MDCAKALLLPRSPRSCRNLDVDVHLLRLLGLADTRRQLVAFPYDEQRQFECMQGGNTKKRRSEELSVRLRMLQARVALTIKFDSLAALIH